MTLKTEMKRSIEEILLCFWKDLQEIPNRSGYSKNTVLYSNSALKPRFPCYACTLPGVGRRFCTPLLKMRKTRKMVPSKNGAGPYALTAAAGRHILRWKLPAKKQVS